jgi:hypothetical protein
MKKPFTLQEADSIVASQLFHLGFHQLHNLVCLFPRREAGHNKAGIIRGSENFPTQLACFDVARQQNILNKRHEHPELHI